MRRSHRSPAAAATTASDVTTTPIGEPDPRSAAVWLWAGVAVATSRVAVSKLETATPLNERASADSPREPCRGDQTTGARGDSVAGNAVPVSPGSSGAGPPRVLRPAS